MTRDINPVTDMVLERTILWQDFTKPQGYRDTLTLVKLDKNKYAYEFQVGGNVKVVPYIRTWRAQDD